MKRRLYFALMCLTQSYLLAACTDPFSRGSGASADAVSSAQAAKAVTYSAVAPILKNYCVSCHAGLANYPVVVGSLADIQQMVFVNHTMPPSGRPQLAPQESTLLENWIHSGAPQDISTTPTPTPPPEAAVPAQWSYISANIINAKCIKCHKADSKHGSLANYNDVFSLGASTNAADPLSGPKVVRGQPENSPLYEVLEDGAKVPMPPKLTGVVVSGAEREAIREWILNGAENDLLP